jgi:hypothetical protein
VVVRRVCAFRFPDGRNCGAAPLRDGQFCLWHDPEHAEAVAEARKVAGQRRRKEATLATVYDLGDVTSDEGIRRLADIAISDLLGQDNSLNRVRAMLYAIQTLLKVREAGDQEERIRALEAAVLQQEQRFDSAFDAPEEPGFPSGAA